MLCLLLIHQWLHNTNYKHIDIIQTPSLEWKGFGLNMSSLPTGCCVVQWDMWKVGGAYLPFQALQFRKLSAARLSIGHALTNCPPIGQVVCHLR